MVASAPVTRRRSDAEIISEVPPRMRARLRRIGLDLEDPEVARHFAEGVRAAEEFTAKEERREGERHEDEHHEDERRKNGRHEDERHKAKRHKDGRP